MQKKQNARLHKRSLCKKRWTLKTFIKKTRPQLKENGEPDSQPADGGASGLDHEVFAFVPQSLAANPKEKFVAGSRRRPDGGKLFRKSRLDKE